MSTMRIYYDDQLEDVVDKVNKALKEKGLAFVDDGQEHDGFCVYRIEEIESEVTSGSHS